MSERRSLLLQALFIMAAVLVAFAPALRAGYVWDDQGVFRNPAVLRPDGLQTIWFQPASNLGESHYWPLVYTVFWAQQRLWGGGPFGNHLVNLLFHAANAVIIWAFLRRAALPGALWAALLFALHPTKVESVAWVIELKDVLSGFFYLLAFWAGNEFAAREKDAGIRWAAASAALFVLALLSKSVAVTLPAALLVFFWWRLEGRIPKRLLLFCAGLLAIGGVVVGLDLWLVGQLGHDTFQIPVRLKALIVGKAVWFYFGKLIWPFGLSAIYPFNPTQLHPESVTAYLYPLAAVLTLGLLWVFRREIGRGPLAGALYFVVTLSPTLGFISFSYMQHSFVADRFQYLASLGVIVPLAVAVAGYAHRVTRPVAAAVAGLGAGVLVVLAGLTWIRCEVYYSAETLFRDVLKTNWNSAAAHINLGDAAVFYGRVEEASEHYKNSVQVVPEFAEARAKYARTLLTLGQIQEAIRQCRIALRLQPDSLPARKALAAALEQAGERDQARAEWQEVLRRAPQDPEAMQALQSYHE